MRRDDTPAPERSYAFARRPRWIVLHALVLAAVALFALAGAWQLRRLDDRRAHNALVTQRRELPPVHSLENDDLAFRRARLEGRYDRGEEVVLTGRPSEGRTGDHVLTPLRLDDGSAILVDRGWMPSDTPARATRARASRVVVEGVLVPSEGGGPLAAGGGEVDRIARIDVGRLDRQIPYRLAPVYLLLAEQRPPQPDDVPEPVRLAPPGEGSHLSYAVQWFAFIAVALVVYGAVLRREAGRGATVS